MRLKRWVGSDQKGLSWMSKGALTLSRKLDKDHETPVLGGKSWHQNLCVEDSLMIREG